MKKYGVQAEAWAPFAEGKGDFFTNETLRKSAEIQKSIAQTALRFLMQSDVVVIPKSTHKERMAENLDVFDFTLSQDDIKEIEKWTRRRVCSSVMTHRKRWRCLWALLKKEEISKTKKVSQTVYLLISFPDYQGSNCNQKKGA